MKTSGLKYRFVLISSILTIAIGCEVTQEKIELWKGTRNGPHKLSNTLIDPEVPVELRAQAAAALVEISSRGWDFFMAAFPKMGKEDAAAVIDAAAPLLAATLKKQEKAVSKAQVDAKDGLFVMLDYASGEGKAVAEQALIDWCSTDFNKRALAGKYNITTIVKKIGPAAAESMVASLKIDELAIQHIAKLIKDVGDPKALAAASQQLAKVLSSNVSKIQEVHLISAAIVGGTPVAEFLLNMAVNNETTAKLQRFSLRAFSQAVADKAIKLKGNHAERLFEMARNTDYDKYQREETYYVIAQAQREEDIEKFLKLLKDRDSFWRAVAFRCILRIDGEGQLKPTLERLSRSKSAKSRDDVDEIVGRISSFPKLLPTVRQLFEDSSTFSKAVAMRVLAKIGTAADADIVSKWLNNGARLPKGFKSKTLGDVAAASLEAIKKKG